MRYHRVGVTVGLRARHHLSGVACRAHWALHDESADTHSLEQVGARRGIEHAVREVAAAGGDATHPQLVLLDAQLQAPRHAAYLEDGSAYGEGVTFDAGEEAVVVGEGAGGGARLCTSSRAWRLGELG